MLDVNGQSIGDGTLELVKFAETASAVNEITVTNSATGNAPEIAATGDDTNIDLKLTPKGTGKLNLDGIKFPNADGSAGQALVTDGSGVLSFATAGLAWQSVQTTGFTAVKGNAYPCDTTSAGFTVTLPATPSAGDQVQVVDYAGTFDTNVLVIDPNGEDIEGGTDNLQLTGEREGAILTYIDSTQGWIATSGINEGTDALSPTPYSIDFLVIAGGGGGGGYLHGGGGGAGGYRTSTQTVNFGTVITVTVGDGGAGGNNSPGVRGTNGSNSSISGSGLTTITSAGGGGGGVDLGAPLNSGLNGGSGGGSTYFVGVGGSGNTPSTSPSQGNNGGSANNTAPNYGTGGGGGASASGTGGSNTVGGAGGNGTASSITGSSITRAGGGGGCVAYGGTKGTGGTGGGGNGAQPGTSAQSGTVNTGGGGGGQERTPAGATSGGKGVVILAMPLARFSGTVTGSPTESDDGTTKVLIFNGSGSYTG
jgi:hypothetical protein